MCMVLYVERRTWASDAYCSQNPKSRGRLIVGVKGGGTVVWVTRLFVNVQLCSTRNIIGRHFVICQANCHLYFSRNDSFPGCIYSATPAGSSKLGVEMIWQERLILLPQLWLWSHKVAWPEVFMRRMAVRHCLGGRDLLSACYVRSPNFICRLWVVTFLLLRCACERSVTVRYVNILAPEWFFLILAHPVYKMWIIQEPTTLELWNKLHFEEEKTEIIYHV